MANIKLDLSKVKHVKSDERSTTLRHQDGHTIHLLHSALAPENKAQLQALSKISKDASQSVDQKMAYGGDAVRKAGADFKKSTGATYGMTPETPTVSHVEGDVRTPEQKSKAEHYYDTPAPSTSDQTPQNTDEDGYHKMAKGGEAELSGSGSPANPIDRPDKGFGSVIVKAEGGKVAKYCMYCGGMAHGGECTSDKPMMAEGGDPVDQIDQAVPQYANKVSLETPSAKVEDSRSPAQARTEALYNQQSSGMTNFGAAKGTLPDEEQMFGPQGQAPQAFNPENYKIAQTQFAEEQADNAAKIAGAQQQAIQQNQVRAQAGLPLLPVPNTPQGPQIPGSEESPPPGTDNPQDPSGQKAITAAATQTDPTDPYAMLQSGYKQQLAGIQGKSSAEQQQAKANADILATAQQAKATALSNYQDQYADLEQERQHHISDIREGYIDPNRYWTGDKDGNGSHSKLAAGIGMILAGFNPTNKPNAAIEFLKYNMDKNMQAQVANLGAKESMLSANLRQFGNIKDATAMTQLMQSDMIQNSLQQAAATAATPMAKAAALTAAGQLKQQDAPMFQEFAMRRAMMNMANNGTGDTNSIEHMMGYMRAINPKAAEEMESRYVPGVGIGSVPVPEQGRQQIISSKNVNDLMNASLQFSAQHKGSLDPHVLAQANTIQQQLIGSIKNAQHDGVYKESEADFLLKQIGGNPASFLAGISSVPKIQELQNIKQMEYKNLLNTYGIKGKALPQTSQNEGQTATNPKTGEKIKMVNGKWTSAK